MTLMVENRSVTGMVLDIGVFYYGFRTVFRYSKVGMPGQVRGTGEW